MRTSENIIEKIVKPAPFRETILKYERSADRIEEKRELSKREAEETEIQEDLIAQAIYEDFDMRHSTAFYRGVSFAQLELNRDISSQKVVALSYIPVDPLAPYVRANQVILVDRRTGLIRVARFGDIDPDKGHLLTPTYDAYRRERNINGSYREVNITEFQRLQGVDDDFKAKLEIEADFWRRWRFYLDHQEDKIEKYLVKRQQKVEHKQEMELERTNEKNLTPEQAVHREVTLDFAQSVSQKESQDRDLELEGGLQLGSDDF